MTFIVDEGGFFEAPLGEVWRFLGSGDEHSRAHGHRAIQSVVLDDRSGSYSWEQPFSGATKRFTMRWTAFEPQGIAYEVLEGPFEGSRFFLYYRAQGPRTAVAIVGEFVSPDIPSTMVEAEVRKFFEIEFKQDSAALRAATRDDPRRS